MATVTRHRSAKCLWAWMALLAMLTILSTSAASRASDFETWVNRGNAAFDQENHAEAIEYYQRALELQPNDTNVLSDISVSYRSTGQSDKAIQSLEKALSIYPEHETALYNLGVVYFYDLKNRDKAAQVWNQFIQVSKSEDVVRQIRELLGTAPQQGQSSVEHAATAAEAIAAYQAGDYANAYGLALAGAEQGEVKAQVVLGILLRRGRGVDQDSAAALQWFRKAAEQGSADAQYWLGTMLSDGEGGPQDYLEAATWYRKAADQGDANAQFYLGVLYRNGQGVPQDYAQAAAWYRKAADQGNAYAQYNLGVLYTDGQGVPMNYAEAATWYRKAADQGHANGQYWLGTMLRGGQGVQKDSAEAIDWFRKAADQGHAKSQALLAALYFQGDEVSLDYAEAAKWARLAVSHEAVTPGVEFSQKILGALYYWGMGVPQDYAEAAKWLRLDASRGNAEAQRFLGTMYLRGTGVPQDRQEGERWLRLAAQQGDEIAQDRLEESVKTERVDKLLRAFRFPEESCSEPSLPRIDASSSTVDQFSRRKSKWIDCLNRASHADQEAFGQLVIEIGGSDEDESFSWPREHDQGVRKLLERKERRYDQRIQAVKEMSAAIARHNQKVESANTAEAVQSGIDEALENLQQMQRIGNQRW